MSPPGLELRVMVLFLVSLRVVYFFPLSLSTSMPQDGIKNYGYMLYLLSLLLWSSLTHQTATSRFVLSTETHTTLAICFPYIMSSIFLGLNKSRLSSHLPLQAQTFFIIPYRERRRLHDPLFVPVMNPDKN